MPQSLLKPGFHRPNRQCDPGLRTLELRLETALVKHATELRRELADAITQAVMIAIVVATVSVIVPAGLLLRLQGT